MAAVAIVALAAGGLVYILGGHSKGSSTSRVGAPAPSTPTSRPPTGFTSPLAAESAFDRDQAGGSASQCLVFPPSDRAWCIASMSEGPVRSTVHPVGDYVNGNDAIVELAGTECAGQQCQTLTPAMQVRPGPDLSFAQAWTKAADQDNATDAYQRIGQFWYLYPGFVVPASAQEPVPTGLCTQVPASLDSPAGSPSTVAGQTAASVADTVVKYASAELNPDALYYRLQNVLPATGAALLPTTEQMLGEQATQVTTATLMTPGAEDDNLAVYRFADPAQATSLVRMFWVVGCAQQSHVDAFNGAVGAYLTVKTPGVINFSTDLVVAVGPYVVAYELPGQLASSTTQPMVAQIVGSLESPSVSPGVDIPDTIGPVA